MAEYIDGDKLCRVIAGHSYYSGDRILSRIRCLQEGKTINKSIKPDDVAPVVHAHWEELGEADFRCSKCGFRFTSGDDISLFPYCRCGAKMDENEKQTPKQGFLEN